MKEDLSFRAKSCPLAEPLADKSESSSRGVGEWPMGGNNFFGLANLVWLRTMKKTDLSFRTLPGIQALFNMTSAIYFPYLSCSVSKRWAFFLPYTRGATGFSGFLSRALSKAKVSHRVEFRVSWLNKSPPTMVTPKGTADLGAVAMAKGKRYRSKYGCRCCHYDRPETQDTGLVNGLSGFKFALRWASIANSTIMIAFS